MMSERDNLKALVEILDPTNRHDDMIKAMKRIIELNPVLSLEERNLLSISYKNVTDVRRNSIHYINQFLKNETAQYPNTIPYLQNSRNDIVNELKGYCNDLLTLVDEKLLPPCPDEKSRVFYIKLKADYCRYLCEALEGEEKDATAKKAQEYYNEAIEIVKKEYPRYSPSYLGIFLNYSVFLYETLHQTEEAIKTAQEISEVNIGELEQNSEAAYNESRTIINLNQENINAWKK